jgi:hypothetical protein
MYVISLGINLKQYTLKLKALKSSLEQRDYTYSSGAVYEGSWF